MQMKNKKNKRGFSLMELLAVMAVMGILATVAMTGYFSAIRSMTRRRVVSNFVATLQQARQRACIDGARTAVVFSSEDAVDAKPNTYVVCKALGRVTSTAGGEVGDEFTPLELIFGKATSATSPDEDYAFGSRKIYNLSGAGGFMEVEGTVKPGQHGILESGITGKEVVNTNQTLLYCFVIASGGANTANFQIGDLYGIEASPVAKLPRNFYFNSSAPVLFKPDGGATACSIEIIDQSVKDSPKVISTISVSSETGSVTGGDKVDLT
jgi:prepilin-type N-terminal cleavage/methylation domain-containing protein